MHLKSKIKCYGEVSRALYQRDPGYMLINIRYLSAHHHLSVFIFQIHSFPSRMEVVSAQDLVPELPQCCHTFFKIFYLFSSIRNPLSSGSGCSALKTFNTHIGDGTARWWHLLREWRIVVLSWAASSNSQCFWWDLSLLFWSQLIKVVW